MACVLLWPADMKILCATDFSPHANRISGVAARLARRLGDSLVLVHALEPLVTPYPDDAAYQSLNALTAGYDKWAREQAALLAKELGKEGTRVETIVESGYAAELVNERAEQLEARLIVVGAHGRGARTPWHLGRTAERIIEHAARPVLVLGEEAAGLERWASAGEALRLLAAIDESTASEAAIDWVRQLRGLAAADVTFLELYWPPEELGRRGLRDHTSAHQQEIVAGLQQRLERRIGALEGKGAAAYAVRPTWSRFGDAVAHAAEELRADLVVVGTHQRHGLDWLRYGSTTRELLREARLPVLCVPASLALPLAKRPLPSFRRVLVPLDLSETSSAAIPYAYALVRELGGTVELVHVAGPTRLAAADRQGLDSQLRAQVPKDAERLGLTTRVSIVEQANAPEAITKLAERLDVDAICMTTRGRSGLVKLALGSVTQGVLERATRPVIVLQPPK